jgi:hypothetical protein
MMKSMICLKNPQKSLFCILVCITLVLLGCTKNDAAVNSDQQTPGGSDYFPFATGRTWTYNSSATTAEGLNDPSANHVFQATIIKTQQLVGGQPNASILQVTNELQSINNYVLFAEPARLWAYFPSLLGIPPTTDAVYYIQGDQISMSLVAGETRRVAIRGSGTFQIVQQPNSAVVRATIAGGDTLVLEAIAAGNSSLRIGKVGTTGSMSILVSVADGGTTGLKPWMAVWEAALTTAEKELYRRDTLFTLKRANGTLLHDYGVYRISNRLIQTEMVHAAGQDITTEKYFVQMTLAETIDSVVAAQTFGVYSGFSSDMRDTLWVSRGIGFVKVTVTNASLTGDNWNSISSSGSTDGQGVFHGIFASPRMKYSSSDNGSGKYIEQLTIDKTGLSPNGTTSFIFTGKNF